MTGVDINMELLNILSEYRDNLKTEVNYRLSNWKYDHQNSAKYHVISGLLSRQASITLETIDAPQILNGLVISIILRSMIDIFITMAWILHDDSENRAQKFIDYGVGQEKIMKDCRESELKSQGIDPESDDFIKVSNAIINIMRKEELVDVNIGSWSGLSVRQMAEESGNLGFYNLTYIPFSQDVHSNWPHLIRFNLEPCENPLHRFHLKGVLKEVEPKLHHNLRNLTKYMNKVLMLFDEHVKLDLSSITPASKILRDKLNSLAERIEKEGVENKKEEAA